MKLPDWINPGLRKQFDQNHSEPKEERLRVTNITRNSVLATQLEVADTGAKRNKGLLGRKGLAPGGGLWIVPCESEHTIGMQFPIDLVYLDRKLRIRKILHEVGPWRISVCLTAHSILELPPGSVSLTQSKPGDTIEFSAAFSSAGAARSMETAPPTSVQKPDAVAE